MQNYPLQKTTQSSVAKSTTNNNGLCLNQTTLGPHLILDWQNPWTSSGNVLKVMPKPISRITEYANQTTLVQRRYATCTKIINHSMLNVAKKSTKLSSRRVRDNTVTSSHPLYTPLNLLNS